MQEFVFIQRPRCKLIGRLGILRPSHLANVSFCFPESFLFAIEVEVGIIVDY